MSIALTAFLQKVSVILDDHISSTPTSAGSTGGTTWIDSGLMKYPDGYFGDPNSDPEWWFYSGTTLRPVKLFSGGTGTGTLHNAFGSQISTTMSYSLHFYDRDKKIQACNLALYECYPDFYLRVDDEATLDGLGSSDVDYVVPTTTGFVDFPDQIWKKHLSSTASDATITYTQITDYKSKLVDGAWKFYAEITEDDDILLVGRVPLTQFTNDASTTELTDIQANTVAYKAASIFCRMKAETVNSQDAGRFKAMEGDHELTYQKLANKTRMARLTPPKSGFDWLDE